MKCMFSRPINDLSGWVGLSTLTPHHGVKFQPRYWVGIYKYLLYNSQQQNSCPLGVLMKGIIRLFNWFKSLSGFPRLQSTAVSQMSTSILIYPVKILTAKFLSMGFKLINFFSVQGSIIPTVRLGIRTCFVVECLPGRVHGGKFRHSGAYNG